MKNLLRLLFFVPIVIIFLKINYTLLDPDFGWNVRMGKILLSKNFSFTDPFSYTMPGYGFVDHEWLTDVFMTLGHDNLGLTGLSIIWALTVIFTLYILIRNPKNRWGYVLYLLGYGIFLPTIGIRPQIISWFLFSFLVILINRSFMKINYLIVPLLFLLWANLHGGFIIGLTYFFIVTFAEIYQQGRNLRKLLLPAFSASVTLINPYGWNLLREIYVYFSDLKLRFNIEEWRPALYFPNLPFIFITVLLIFFLFRYRTKYRPREMFPVLLFLIFALTSIRNIPFYTILTIPLLIKGYILFSREASKIKYGKARLEKAALFILIISLIIFIIQTVSAIRNAYFLSEKSYYPQKAILFLRNLNTKGQLFSDYNWGGYLILNYPEKKVFIDGRMPSWKQAQSDTESSDAYGDYINIIEGKNIEENFLKYNIDSVLIRRTNLNNNLPSSSFALSLQKMGFKMVYSDNIAIVLHKSALYR